MKKSVLMVMMTIFAVMFGAKVNAQLDSKLDFGFGSPKEDKICTERGSGKDTYEDAVLDLYNLAKNTGKLANIHSSRYHDDPYYTGECPTIPTDEAYASFTTVDSTGHVNAREYYIIVNYEPRKLFGKVVCRIVVDMKDNTGYHALVIMTKDTTEFVEYSFSPILGYITSIKEVGEKKLLTNSGCILMNDDLGHWSIREPEYIKNQRIWLNTNPALAYFFMVLGMDTNSYFREWDPSAKNPPYKSILLQ